MARLLIVDDDHRYRSLLRTHLERAKHGVFEATSGQQGLALARNTQLDIALLDFNLPGEDGPRVCRQLRRESTTASLPLMMVTARGDEEARIEAFEAGADDYVLKPFSIRELLLRIRVLVEGGPWGLRGSVSVGALTLDFDAHRVSLHGERRDLTRTELALLRALSLQPTRVWTRNELLDSIWGSESEVDTRVVDGLVRRVREKLGPGAACIQTVRGVGYRFDGHYAGLDLRQ